MPAIQDAVSVVSQYAHMHLLSDFCILSPLWYHHAAAQPAAHRPRTEFVSHRLEPRLCRMEALQT